MRWLPYLFLCTGACRARAVSMPLIVSGGIMLPGVALPLAVIGAGLWDAETKKKVSLVIGPSTGIVVQF